MSSLTIGPFPISVIASVEIKEDCLDEFLRVIEIDAVGSRTNENGGCLRFDVLRDPNKKNCFTFYEVYKDKAAVENHKESEHFKVWTNFKESGAVLSLTVSIFDAISFTGSV
mmetsp:Transcript_16835/g.23164  ORF Transcript_16835/g.23164 Transcript_16835/m.23164 type:complete len:112 (+) Transcript_16835:50-385(+)